MTREKAIEYFEKAREASNSCTELYDMAIAALREQLTTNCHQLETVTNRNGFNRTESDTVKGVEIDPFNTAQHGSNTDNALGGWISFDERFPDDSFLEKAIIVCIKNRWNEQRVDTVHWHGNEQRLNAPWFWGDVTHWMPLPKPPKEEV